MSTKETNSSENIIYFDLYNYHLKCTKFFMFINMYISYLITDDAECFTTTELINHYLCYFHLDFLFFCGSTYNIIYYLFMLFSYFFYVCKFIFSALDLFISTSVFTERFFVPIVQNA